MLYPIYDYYHESSLTLEEVIHHYVENFYFKKHGRNKYEKILQKLSESDKVKKLFSESYNKRLAINNVDMASTINTIMWFMIQTNETQAVAVLSMANLWNETVNSRLSLKTERELRDDALLIFKKFQIYGDMTQAEFDSMRKPQIEEEEEEEEVEENIEEGAESGKGNGYYILNFYLECSYCRKQEDEIKKCPLVLPVRTIDVDEETDITLKYKVNQLPNLVLVDGDGNEIHRWVGITPTSEINDYIVENGYGVMEDDGEEDENDFEEDDEGYEDVGKEAQIRSLIRKDFEKHMAKTINENTDLINDPMFGGMMLEGAIGIYFNSLKNQEQLHILSTMLGVDLNKILDDECKKAIKKYLK